MVTENLCLSTARLCISQSSNSRQCPSVQLVGHEVTNTHDFISSQLDQWSLWTYMNSGTCVPVLTYPLVSADTHQHLLCLNASGKGVNRRRVACSEVEGAQRPLQSGQHVDSAEQVCNQEILSQNTSPLSEVLVAVSI